MNPRESNYECEEYIDIWAGFFYVGRSPSLDLIRYHFLYSTFCDIGGFDPISELSGFLLGGPSSIFTFWQPAALGGAGHSRNQQWTLHNETAPPSLSPDQAVQSKQENKRSPMQLHFTNKIPEMALSCIVIRFPTKTGQI
ncbi:hypothetical protein ABW19_dt0207248 [Dactylella cylindrospora]|nr:hypothetical protein ABW19_dt0207248 [Dactylella cylindrospora]